MGPMSDAEVRDLLVTMSRAVTTLVQQQQVLAGAIVGIRDELAEIPSKDDLRRSTDRVLGEVKAIEDRLGGMGEEVRVLRVLRDRVDALADGVDGVRQLAARSATSQQMTDVSRELGAVLGEIAAARGQIVHIEQVAVPAMPAAPPVTERLRHLGNVVLDDLRARRQRARR